MIVMMDVKQKIAKLAEKYGLSLVILFGSQATGKTHNESDVDIAYTADRNLDFTEQTQLNADFIEVFKNDKIDLVDAKRASPLLLRLIARNGVVLFERTPHVFDEFYVYALKIYDEAKPLFELRRHYLEFKIANL